MQKTSICRSCALMLLPIWLFACTPTYDWREVRGDDLPFVVLMPAKPAAYSQPVRLAGMQIEMTMTAAEIGRDVFAVGAARVPGAANAANALTAMKNAMVQNINGTITREESSSAKAGNAQSIEINASGISPVDGKKRYLAARFIARGDRVYPAVVIGSGDDVPHDAIDMFLSSFKPG